MELVNVPDLSNLLKGANCTLKCYKGELCTMLEVVAIGFFTGLWVVLGVCMGLLIWGDFE